DIVAFVLQKNGYPTGNKEIGPTDASLKTTMISALPNGIAARDVGRKIETAGTPTEPAATASRPSTGKPTQAELNAAAKDTDWLMSNHDYGGPAFLGSKTHNRQTHR